MTTLRPLLLSALLALAAPTMAQQHAHTHGRLALDVAVDTQALSLQLHGPLDGLLGFERAPRTETERRRVADLAKRLQAADTLLVPDAQGGCRLAQVDVHSSVPGQGTPAAAAEHGHGHDHGHAHGKGHGPAEGDPHADIDVDITFNCAQAGALRHVDLAPLFAAFPRVRQIDAQVATPRGQARRTLAPQAARLDLPAR